VLWGIQLFIFACIGILIFGDMAEYGSFIKVLILFFESALGQWDFTIYNNSKYPPLFGQAFHMIVIMLNMIMFVNLMIAVLSETYQRLSIQKLGLYYDGVIEVIPAYKYKKFYGSLIAACPPFNLLVLPFLPFFAFAKNKRTIRRLNNTLVKIIFFPFALIYATFFGIGNLLMVPVAYIVTVYNKFKIIFDRDMVEQRKQLGIRFVSFFFIGLPVLMISQFVDIYFFIIHLYVFNSADIQNEIVPTISPEAFNTLEAVVKREIHRLKDTNFKHLLHMPTRDFIKILREELEIATCIQSLIFGKFLSLKDHEEAEIAHIQKQKYQEIYDQNLSTSRSSFNLEFDTPLHRIKVFNQIKKILLRMTRQNGMISLTLLDGLLFDLRNKMTVEIARFKGYMDGGTTQSSLGDFQFADKGKIVGATAQIMQNYFVHDVKLPPAVLKL